MHADCRYHSHSTGQHLQTFAGQSRGQSIPYQQQDQSSSRSVHAELPAQHALCTVSTAPQQALSELCLQLPLGAHQQQQLQAHLQLHHRYQLDLAAKHLAEQPAATGLLQSSRRARVIARWPGQHGLPSAQQLESGTGRQQWLGLREAVVPRTALPQVCSAYCACGADLILHHPPCPLLRYLQMLT